jgi:para-aminobenzoate synthetase component 1
MDLRDDSFWMGRRYARSLLEVTNDLSRLDDGNFWAVAISFEGQVTLARFQSNFEADFPFSGSHWSPIEGDWVIKLTPAVN